MRELIINTEVKVVEKIGNIKLKANNIFTRKKQGDDKLIVALVLAALGVGLCIYFRNGIYDIMTDTVSTLKTQINSLLAGTVK
ncbi:hypothetical protein [Clostridium manihotivorum]|uniref:Uncharacterized protein n=1 Tax=Clostridium manihotivorum TaxID=2320868 RepID=A0A3R5X296_9CLOT|nr:hypothetical protein [Clostridium manihotivorum]ERI90706.1 hypothetical protein HMPREF1982_03744 [Clostridiales bacterium oral taxon 876 str. F0540]QAA32710.1 hypothetical protein C1I91_14295 [Clostridium manihotivorum]